MTSLNTIQALRAIAAVLVVVTHAFTWAGHSFGTLAEDRVAVFGRSGVMIFFVISGFIMVYTNQGRFGAPGQVRAFLRRRFVRIYPVYWLLALANIPLLVWLGILDDPRLAEVAGALALMPGDSSTLIFVGWTLTYEIYFYLVFSLVLPVQRRMAVPVLTALLCVLVMLRFVLPAGQAAGLLHLATNSLLLAFLAGAWIAWGHLHLRQPSMWAGGLLAIIGAAGLGANFAHPNADLPTVISYGVPAALIVAGALAFERRPRIGLILARCRRLGDASYSLYLGHAVLIPVLATLLVSGGRLGGPEMAVWIIAMVALCSWLSIVFSEAVERPMIRAVNARLSGRRRVPVGREGW